MLTSALACLFFSSTLVASRASSIVISPVFAINAIESFASRLEPFTCTSSLESTEMLPLLDFRFEEMFLTTLELTSSLS